MKIYRDEAIRFSPRETAGFTPQKYLAMRRLDRGADVYSQPEASIFYRQGKFMEDFEDDFVYDGEFVKYFPTYRAMNDTQLRGYFSWRTQVRRGRLEKSSLSFAFVYIYELLNLIGVSSAEEGFQTLKHFWQNYREMEPKLDRYVPLWLNDFVVYYDLDAGLLEEFGAGGFDRAVLVLLKGELHTAEEVFAALNTLSSYDLGSSRFYKQHPEEVTEVVYRVFLELTAYFRKNRKNSLCEKFFGKMLDGSYEMFRAAVFYSRAPQEDRTYEVNEIRRFRCVRGSWRCERFLGYKPQSAPTGVLLKSIDFVMRRRYGFKSTLKVDKITALYTAIIENAIEQMLAERRRRTLPTIEIDLGSLSRIRENALETQKKLIVEEKMETEVAVLPEREPEWSPTTDHPLNAAESELLRCLLAGESCATAVKKSEGQMLSVLIDGINEKLFDRFSDTVILCDGETPELVEEYREELKGIIQP